MMDVDEKEKYFGGGAQNRKPLPLKESHSRNEIIDSPHRAWKGVTIYAEVESRLRYFCCLRITST